MTVEINFVRLVIAPYWCVSCEMAHWKEQLQPRGNCVSYGRRGRTFDADLLIAHLHTVRRAGTHTHAQVMLYYADLLKVNLITLVIPDQRVFLPVKNPSSGKKKEKNMTTNQKVISWRWHQRQANPSERRQSVDVLPRVVPGEVPGGPRHILHASALRLCVLVTRTERSLGPNALNHTPPPTHCHGRRGRLMQKYWERQSGYWSNPLVCSRAIITSSYSNWYRDIWCCYDTSPCFWEHPQCQQGFTQSEWFPLNAF